MHYNFTNLVLYPCGICNLKCKYCDIDKNPALVEVDKAIAASFEGDYYKEQIKKFFPDRGKLECIETWGGEPFMFLERIYSLIDWCINEYPYFAYFYSSTNFSYPQWNDKLFGLIKVFNKYDYRDFHFQLQLSVDGPEYINDRNRGIGTTQKCLANFKTFIERAKNELGPNIRLTVTPKLTLDISNIYELNTKEKIIEYYQFFEDNFVRPIRELHYTNLLVSTPHPNTAVPSPVLVEDGIQFAQFCKMCNEIEEENKTQKYFEFYEDITPYCDGPVTPPETICYNFPGFTCQQGVKTVGILPEGKYTCCHGTFGDFASKYKAYAKDSKRLEEGTISFDKFLSEQPIHLCVDEQGYEKFQDFMESYNDINSTFRLGILVNQIRILAMAGQIEKRFADEEAAVRAGIWFQAHGGNTCIKDNYQMCGTKIMCDHGLYKLLLNGASKYIRGMERGGMTWDGFAD